MGAVCGITSTSELSDISGILVGSNTYTHEGLHDLKAMVGVAAGSHASV